YYYWNMETNEVQWDPPSGFQFQTADVTNGEQDEEYSRTSYDADDVDDADDNRYDDNDESTLCEEPPNEFCSEKATEDVESIPCMDVNKHVNQLVNQDDENSNDSRSEFPSKRGIEDPSEDLSAKKIKFASESVDDFADQLLEDTYDQGQRDVRDEANMEMSDDEDKKIEENL
ncbi:hypothetical protein AC249_AIPGENE20903, partial [Exaiptasia diaphana]